MAFYKFFEEHDMRKQRVVCLTSVFGPVLPKNKGEALKQGERADLLNIRSCISVQGHLYGRCLQDSTWCAEHFLETVMDWAKRQMTDAAMGEHGCQGTTKSNCKDPKGKDVIDKDSLRKESTKLDIEKKDSCKKVSQWDRIPSSIQKPKANRCLSENLGQIGENGHEVGEENSAIALQKQEIVLQAKDKLPNSESGLNDIKKRNSFDMPCKSADNSNQDTNRKDVFVNVKHKVKSINDNSKYIWKKSGHKTFYTKDIENISTDANFDHIKFSVEKEACPLFEEQLQELEKQSAEKCLKFKFIKKKNKFKKKNALNNRHSFKRHKKTKEVSSHNHENTKLCRKNIHKDKSNEKHKNGDRKHVTTSDELYRNSLVEKQKKYLPPTNEISLSYSDNGRIQTENSRQSVEIQNLKELSGKTLNFQNRCYRLQSSQWNAGERCALRLLKRKYLSVRTLFHKEPVIYLEQLNINGTVKMIGENFEVISMWEAETDTTVCSDDVEANREVSSEEASLVDPRVMSLSRTLESGHNGKIGVEKTFKNSSCKNSQAKTKICFKLQTAGNVKKPLVQKPDWCKLKERLKEVNAKQALQKKQAELDKAKGNKRIPVLKNNPCFNLKNHANPKVVSERVKSNRNNCKNSSVPIIQERKKELEKLCPASDAVQGITQQGVNDISSSEKTLEEFQKDLDESDIDFKMDEYSIEICTESIDEDQSKDSSVEGDLLKNGNSDTDSCQTEDILNSGQDTVEKRLTVTSGIIPNLYVTDGLQAEVLDDESLSPPVLQREGVDGGEVIALNQYEFVIKSDPDSDNGTIFITSNDLTLENCSSIKKEEGNPNISEHIEINTVPSEIENVETNDNDPVLHVDSVISGKNAQNIPEKIKNVDNSAPLSHLALIDSSDNVKDSEALGSSVVCPPSSSSSSSSSHLALSRSNNAQNYPKMAEKVFTENMEYHEQEKANNGVISPGTQTDIRNTDDYDKRSSTSPLSSSEESLMPDQSRLHDLTQQKASQEHEQDNNPLPDTQIDGPNKLPVQGSFVFDKSGQPLEILAVTTLSNVHKVFGDLPTLTWINSRSPVKENINANEAEHQKKKVGKKDRPKPEKIYRKRKKSLERKYSLENDSEELPKISPPKRRPRPVAKASPKPSDSLSEERLMQDFPKHNWLFNKYSSLSTSTASINNRETAGDPKPAKESVETLTRLGSSAANTLTMKHEKELENTSGSRLQVEIVEPSTAMQLNILSNTPPSVSSASLQPVYPPSTAQAFNMNSSVVDQSSFSSRSNNCKPVSPELDHHNPTIADTEKSVIANKIGSSRKHSISELVSPELGHHEKSLLETLENSAAKMDVLKSNFHDDSINLHYDKGSSEQVNHCSVGHHDSKMDEEIDKNASRLFSKDQSFKKQGDNSNCGLHMDRNSCDKGVLHTVEKSVDFEKMETLGYCDTALQEAGKNVDQDLKEQKYESDIDCTSRSQVCAASHPADKSSVDMEITMLHVQANSSGNASHSEQEVVAMVTKEGESRESVPQEVCGSLEPESPGTIPESNAVKTSADESSTVDLGNPLQSCEKMGPTEACSAKPVSVEASGGNFRQKPNPPVLRVQPHLYKPPVTVRIASPDPRRPRGTSEIPISLDSTVNGSVPFSRELSIATTQGDNNSISPDHLAQNKGAAVLESISVSPLSSLQSVSNAQNVLESKTPDKLQIAEVAVPSALGTFPNTRNNTGMVIPVQPIIQTTVSATVTSGNITVPSLNSTASSNSIRDHLVTNQSTNLNSNDRTLLPVTASSASPPDHIPVNPQYLYHQQPAIIRVQTPTINPSGVFEINRITQIPQTNQLFLLESDTSVIPISTQSTGSVETSNQCVFAGTVQSAQEQPHIGQILSSSHIIFAQPVCARAAQSSLKVIDNSSEVLGVRKIDCNATNTSERVTSADSEDTVRTSNNLNNNSDDKQRVSGIVKNEESKSQEVLAAALSDEDEEFKRQMEELDREIKRKEREHEEMRLKKLELLEKRRRAAEVKSEEKQEGNLVEASTGPKVKLDGKEQIYTEEANFHMIVDCSKYNSVVKKDKVTISDKDSISVETELNATEKETDTTYHERNKQLITTETDNTSVEAEAGHQALQDDSEDDSEDKDEGALVIDLSATSKESRHSQLALQGCLPSTQVTLEGEVESKIQPGIKKQCNSTYENQQLDAHTDSIDYIEDIGRVNPFTGEMDDVVSDYNVETLDLSNKSTNQVRADNSGTDTLEESLHSDNVSKFCGNDNVKQSLEDDTAISDFSQQTDRNRDEDACEMVSKQDNGSLDLSVKPLCVFTFKEVDETTNTPYAFCPESNPENDLLTQMKKMPSRFSKRPDDTALILNTDKESMFEPESENAALENESRGMKSNMIASAISRKLPNSAITNSALDEEIHTPVGKSQFVYGHSQGNMLSKRETNTDEYIENLSSESENSSCNRHVVDNQPIISCSIQTSITSAPTFNIGRSSVVGNQALAIDTDIVSINRSLQPAQNRSSVHLRQSPANEVPYRPQVSYKPMINDQNYVGPLGLQSSEVPIPPHRERMPGYLPVCGSSSSLHSQGQHGTQVLHRRMKHTEPFEKTSPFCNIGLNSARNDLKNRGHSVGRQQAQRRSKEMYMEIEPAHIKPLPKKIPKHAKPSPAHIHEINMKEIFKKMNKSHCQIPLVIQQSGPYFKRRDPVFQAPGDNQGNTRSMNDKPKPAHCQQPFRIAGQLIVTRKRPCKRIATEEIVASPPKRFLSVPPSSPPPQVEVQRSSSSTPNIPYATDDGYIEVVLPSQRSSEDDITSPIRAHSSADNFDPSHNITTDQVLRPPLSFKEGCKDSSPKTSEIIDLTVAESPKVEVSDHFSPVSERQNSTEIVIQTELSAAIAKRQNNDFHLSAGTKVPPQIPVSRSLPQHVVTEARVPPHSKPPPPAQYGNFQLRMPAPQSRPTRLRQPDYSRPRQVLAPVPVDRSRLPEPVSRSSIHQTLVSHQGNRVPSHAYLQEWEPVPKNNHHSPKQDPYQAGPRSSAVHDQQHLMTYRQGRNVGPSVMTELSSQTVDKMLPHDVMYSTNSGVQPCGKNGLHNSTPNISQPVPDFTGQRQPSSEKAYQQFNIPPPNKQQVEPIHGRGHHHVQPRTSPRHPLLSPTSPHEQLPPSSRGDMQQNWSQIQKMQQVRANHLRNRDLQGRQSMVAREMPARPGYSNMVHPGMVENFIQGQVPDPSQKYQLGTKQHPVQQAGLQPHKTMHMQTMETGHQNNQFFGPHSMINQYGPVPQTANQMVTKKQLVSPPASTRYYHLGPPEAQFITTVHQMPLTHPNQQSGQSRVVATTQTTYQHQTKHPGVIQGYHNQPVAAHSMRHTEQVIQQGQHQYFPQKSWPGSSPQSHRLASNYPVNNLSIPQGHGQVQVQERSGQHTQGITLTKVPQDFSRKTGQDLEQGDMPHRQQVNGTCVLCGRYSLYLCSNCKKIWYCSPECQLKHWQTHANECKGPGG